MESNATDDVVVLEGRKSREKDCFEESGKKVNFLNQFFNGILDRSHNIENKNENGLIRSLGLSEMIEIVNEYERPKRIVINLNLSAEDCISLKGK